ncbi:MAG: hypothetical protein HYW25_05835 [Candidatus Aenigmarchaeota archaeon]|nr:hypothetical protein [Candidatus Aenigmarchaeota archaeon]
MPVSADRSMQKKYSIVFMIIIAILAAALYFSGFLVDEAKIDIAGCEASYNTIQKAVRSDLCPDPQTECIAEPFVSEHNAFVEAALCACEKTKTDPNAARALEEKYKNRFDAVRTAEDICSGNDLVKWTYG